MYLAFGAENKALPEAYGRSRGLVAWRARDGAGTSLDRPSLAGTIEGGFQVFHGDTVLPILETIDLAEADEAQAMALTERISVECPLREGETLEGDAWSVLVAPYAGRAPGTVVVRRQTSRAELTFMVDDVRWFEGRLMSDIDGESEDADLIFADPVSLMLWGVVLGAIASGVIAIGDWVLKTIFQGRPLESYFDESYRRFAKLLQRTLQEEKIKTVDSSIKGLITWRKLEYGPEREHGRPPKRLIEMLEARIPLFYDGSVQELERPENRGLGIATYLVAAGAHITLLQEIALQDKRNRAMRMDKIREAAAHYHALAHAAWRPLLARVLNSNPQETYDYYRRPLDQLTDLARLTYDPYPNDSGRQSVLFAITDKGLWSTRVEGAGADLKAVGWVELPSEGIHVAHATTMTSFQGRLFFALPQGFLVERDPVAIANRRTPLSFLSAPGHQRFLARGLDRTGNEEALWAYHHGEDGRLNASMGEVPRLHHLGSVRWGNPSRLNLVGARLICHAGHVIHVVQGDDMMSRPADTQEPRWERPMAGLGRDVIDLDSVERSPGQWDMYGLKRDDPHVYYYRRASPTDQWQTTMIKGPEGASIKTMTFVTNVRKDPVDA